MANAWSVPVRTTYSLQQRVFLFKHFVTLAIDLEYIYDQWFIISADYSERLFEFPAELVREMLYYCNRINHHLQHALYPESNVRRLGEALCSHYYGRYLNLAKIADNIFYHGGFTSDNMAVVYESWCNEEARLVVPETTFNYLPSYEEQHNDFMSLFLLEDALLAPGYSSIREMLLPDTYTFEDTLTVSEIEALGPADDEEEEHESVDGDVPAVQEVRLYEDRDNDDPDGVRAMLSELNFSTEPVDDLPFVPPFVQESDIVRDDDPTDPFAGLATAEESVRQRESSEPSGLFYLPMGYGNYEEFEEMFEDYRRTFTREEILVLDPDDEKDEDEDDDEDDDEDERWNSLTWKTRDQSDSGDNNGGPSAGAILVSN